MTDDQSNVDDTECEYRETSQGERTVGDDWADVPTNPDPSALGYERGEWERIPTAQEGQIIFLPGEEEDLEDDAFVVLEESALCDLVTRR